MRNRQTIEIEAANEKRCLASYQNMQRGSGGFAMYIARSEKRLERLRSEWRRSK